MNSLQCDIYILLHVLFLFWTGLDFENVHFFQLSTCADCRSDGDNPTNNMKWLAKQWCLTREPLYTLMSDSCDEWIPIRAQSVISVLGPVSVAGLQLKKILQGLCGCGSNDGCVYRHVTNQIHGKYGGAEWTTRRLQSF